MGSEMCIRDRRTSPDSGKPADDFFPNYPRPPTTTRTWTSFKWAQQSSATPRCLRAGTRGRRAGGASSRLSCDAARATFSSCLTPGRCSARASSMVEAAALRSAAAPLGSWCDRSAPSASALSRVGELAGRRMTRQSCLLTDPQVRRLTLSAGCSEWERRLKPQLRTLVRVRVRVSSQPRRSRHPRRRHPRRVAAAISPPSRLHLASISPPSLACICHLASTSVCVSPPPPSASRLQLASVCVSPPARLQLASVSLPSRLHLASSRLAYVWKVTEKEPTYMVRSARGSALLR